MNPKIRLAIYVLLVGGLAVCCRGFMAALQSAGPPPVPASTNATVTLLVTIATNASGVVVTNTRAVTNAAEAVEEPTPRQRSPRMGRVMAFGITGFFLLIGLAVLAGHDTSKYFANRVNDFIFNDNLEGVKDPEYEEAERVWSTGQHLEAIQLMRDYLKRHPREQYVALRIAEIYEADLRNYLAAALEYEEILKKRLPAERWGWAAVHLANLYSGRLNRTEEATALLRRIVDEYGQTAAAKKARDRLGIPEPIETTPAAPLPAPEAPPPPESSPHLPPGFRPK